MSSMPQGISTKEIPKFEMKSECPKVLGVPLVQVDAAAAWCPVPITITIAALPLAAPELGTHWPWLPLPDAASPRRTEQIHDCFCAMTAGCDSSSQPWRAVSCRTPVPHTTVLMVDDSSDLRCLLGRDLRYSRCRRASSWFCRT